MTEQISLCEECLFPLKRKNQRFCNAACKEDFEASQKVLNKKKMGPAVKHNPDFEAQFKNKFLLAK